MSNGIRVATERTASQHATIGVYGGYGSRNDTIATSGISNVCAELARMGTRNRNYEQIMNDLNSMGARKNKTKGREVTGGSITVFKDDIARAVDLVADMSLNYTFDAAHLEVLKQQIVAEHENQHHNMQYTTLENAHFNSFRDHMLGQPILGEADLIGNITVDDCHQFAAANWFGDNAVIVGTGNIDHNKFVDLVNNSFQSAPKTATGEQPNKDKAVYTPSMLFIRDDEMYNSNVAVFYDAPGIKHEDYYAFLLLKHMFGSYRIDKHAEHLNDVKKQYNSMHALLGDLPDVTMADSHYFAYSDAGLFGNYFFGNEVFTRQMNYCGVCLPTIYGHYLNEVEVIRGRNHLWNSLLN